MTLEFALVCMRGLCSHRCTAKCCWHSRIAIAIAEMGKAKPTDKKAAAAEQLKAKKDIQKAVKVETKKKVMPMCC